MRWFGFNGLWYNHTFTNYKQPSCTNLYEVNVILTCCRIQTF